MIKDENYTRIIKTSWHRRPNKTKNVAFPAMNKVVSKDHCGRKYSAVTNVSKKIIEATGLACARGIIPYFYAYIFTLPIKQMGK